MEVSAEGGTIHEPTGEMGPRANATPAGVGECVLPHPLEHVRSEAIEVLADLLLEALGGQKRTERSSQRRSAMNVKITPEHLGCSAVVYIRQSTLGQVMENTGNTESQRRQYAPAESASGMGFSSVAVIIDDLGRSGSGIVARPASRKLVANACSGAVGAVFCIEASRLARNGRDWHHLVDLCAVPR